MQRDRWPTCVLKIIHSFRGKENCLRDLLCLINSIRHAQRLPKIWEFFSYSTCLISLVMFLWQLIAFLVVVYLCDEVLLSITSPSLLPSLPGSLCKANFIPIWQTLGWFRQNVSSTNYSRTTSCRYHASLPVATLLGDWWHKTPVQHNLLW